MAGPIAALKAEPIAVTEAVKNLLLATLGGLQVFNVIHLTPEQNGAIIAWYIAASVALSAVARALSVPSKNVAMTNEQATIIAEAKEPT